MLHFVCFSTMKFSRGFSILILLFILQLQASIAVQCPNAVAVDKEKGDFVFSGSKTCEACTYFACADVRMCGKTEQMLYNDKPNGTKYGTGCPEDFYNQCSEFSSDIEFIRNKSANEIDYISNFTNPEVPIQRVVSYVAGCADETDGAQCIKDHAIRTEEQFQNAAKIAHNKNRMVYWKAGKETGSNETLDNGKCSVVTTQTSSGPSYDPNGALKFLGIIAIGWSIAAWIY